MPAGFYQLKVDKITRETADAVSIRFLVPPPLKQLFVFQAGQFLTLHAMINGEDIRRSYSVCESPYVDEMPTVAVKAVEDGRMSRFLNSVLKEGDLIYAMPPMGHFTVEPKADQRRHYVLFGGGSGITPLKSIMITVLLKEPLSRITLFYANRDMQSIIFKKSIDEMVETYGDRLRVVYILDNPPAGWDGISGLLSAPKIQQLINTYKSDDLDTHYYICGPGGMMALVKSTLSDMKVGDDHIHLEYFSAVVKEKPKESEEFDPLADDSKIVTRMVRVEVYGSIEDIKVSPNKTILEAAQDAGLDPPFSCQVGVCTTCRAKVYKGRVKMTEREGLSDAEVEEGYILTCQSHPLSDGVELVYE